MSTASNHQPLLGLCPHKPKSNLSNLIVVCEDTDHGIGEDRRTKTFKMYRFLS